ncbi:hypothetical protein B0T25DRAFT_100945 [Lasiosphaeria hispida]|uniref:Uncharacterized protein n=1 Tax=Lasiosphaeria hispida TaxID=260671 RepID=A0AAJ0MHR6_9PEZI|nr:hypothetical protein B0T25DRAFT_100945 [Lasiosphaeria hispida]
MPRSRRSIEERREMIREMDEQYERDEPKRRAEAAQREAEITRRASLHPTERLAEDGVKLRQKIESNDDMIAVLEVSRSARAGCRAGDCFYAPRIHIQDEFRIRVEGVRGEFDPAHFRTKHYYHVLCFEAMMDLGEIIPSGKFVCDAGETWGLLVRKWFQHRGRINEKVLVEYIKEREEWDKKHSGGFSPALIRALFANTERRGADDGTEGIASSSASVPETTVASRKEDGSPVLREYEIDEGWVSLFFLLRLPEIGAGRIHFMQDPRRPFMLQAVDPWPDAYERVEAEEYGPKTEEEVSMEIERQRNRQDEKQETMRMVWEIWHRPATEVPDSLDPDDDDAEAAEGAGEGHKRRRSHSDGEESEEKRRKI